MRRGDFKAEEILRNGISAWVTDGAREGALFGAKRQVTVSVPVRFEGFGKPYVPPTRWQRFKSRVWRFRTAIARPFQWLADRVRGYQLGDYE